jgi:hypothetical protein
MSRRDPPRQPPDLRQFAGMIYLESHGTSNGRYLRDPRGRALLPGMYQWSRWGPKELWASPYGSHVTPVTEALGLSPIVNRSHGSNRYGGLSYSSEWWVTRRQLAAIRAADDLLREERYVDRISLDNREEVEAALVAAAMAVMAKTEV